MHCVSSFWCPKSVLMKTGVFFLETQILETTSCMKPWGWRRRKRGTCGVCICISSFEYMSRFICDPKCCTLFPRTRENTPNLWILTQLHDYFLSSEFLGVEMLQKCSLSPFSFFLCGGRVNSFLSAVL